MPDGTKVPEADDAFWYDGKTTRRRFVGWGGGILGATMLVPAYFSGPPVQRNLTRLARCNHYRAPPPRSARPP